TSKSGDVHSNGQLDVYIPVNEYFFKSGTAGVVSAANTIQHIQNDRLVSTGLSRWRIPNYSSRVQTRSFDSLLALARSAQDNPNAEFPSQLPTTGNLNSLCAQGAKVYHYRGNWTRSGNLDMSNAPQCANANLVFFVDGNVTHNGNVIDGTNGGTITFIVQGNISVNPNVT